MNIHMIHYTDYVIIISVNKSLFLSRYAYLESKKKNDLNN